MGSASSKPDGNVGFSSSALPSAEVSSSSTTQNEKSDNVNTSSSACPYKGSGGSGGGGFMSMGCPVKHDKKKKEEPPSKKKKEEGEYKNVYSQSISDVNNMPSQANQLPAPEQTEELSTDRVNSTIPKADGSSNWVYPSPQMFYNALVRKNKLDDETTEDDMESVVALHNNMNERTWKQVIEWEKLSGYGDSPKLLKFMGRPTELTPKARFKHYVLGHPLPFDRHDWTIVRDDGTKVRYVIDYYHDDNKSSEEDGSGLPSLTDRVESLLVDVRPAIDSPMELYQRTVSLPYALYFAKEKTELELLPLRPSPSLITQVQESQNVWDNVINAKPEEEQSSNNLTTTAMMEESSSNSSNISQEEAKALAIRFGIALQECEASQKKLENCKSEAEYQQASLDALQCYGKLWCPLQHDALMKTLTSADQDEQNIEATLDHLNMCVVGTQERMGEARNEYPKVWAKVPEF